VDAAVFIREGFRIYFNILDFAALEKPLGHLRHVYSVLNGLAPPFDIESFGVLM